MIHQFDPETTMVIHCNPLRDHYSGVLVILPPWNHPKQYHIGKPTPRAQFRPVVAGQYPVREIR